MSDSPNQTVLIIEADRALSASLAAAVQVSGYQVTRAADAEDALKTIYGGARFHAVLVAYSLPRLSGADFCALFVALESNASAIVIGMSSDHRNEVEMLAAGAGCFLTKPFSMAVLKATLAGVHQSPLTEQP